jgi:hypothetical protein
MGKHHVQKINMKFGLETQEKNEIRKSDERLIRFRKSRRYTGGRP